MSQIGITTAAGVAAAVAGGAEGASDGASSSTGADTLDDATKRAIATASDAAPSHFQLRIVVQPSAKTVYQRILRPYPSVMLEGLWFFY